VNFVSCYRVNIIIIFVGTFYDSSSVVQKGLFSNRIVIIVKGRNYVIGFAVSKYV